MTYIDGLETDRLITRFLTTDDAIPWLEYCKDPIATTFTSFGNSPEEMSMEGMHFAIKRYVENRYGLQALILKETDEFVGMCGLMTQVVNGKEVIEIGYHLIRRYWGKGYASEAAMKFRDYGFENRVSDAIVSIIHPDNILSKKVAMRNGMRVVDEHAIFRDKIAHLYQITRQEWEQIRTNPMRK